MIFASDIDRTLMHPVDELGRWGISARQVRVVEMYNGAAVSCMSERSIALLTELAERHTFVPATTRSVEQYLRIEVIPELAELAVACNGGAILRAGTADPVWADRMRQLLLRVAAVEEIEERMVEAAKGARWLLRHKRVDTFFWYGIVDLSSLPRGLVRQLSAELDGRGWACHLHGRKLYAVPHLVNKWDAVARIVADHASKPVVTAGDSVLDECMLRAEGIARAYSPAAGELARGGAKGITLTSAPHVLGTEEMLETILADYPGEQLEGPDRPARRSRPR